jgi:D-sedoheptulose 7-phosphate isomerase
MLKTVVDRLHQASMTLEDLSQQCSMPVVDAAGVIAGALQDGHVVLLFGNGGSAAEAEHIAGELVGKYLLRRQALAAVCLNTNTAIMTAVANDYGYEHVFSRQIEAAGHPGDVAVGLSTSGCSPNVTEGLSRARQLGLHTIALTGRSGGNIKGVADICICVPSDAVPRIQEAHLAVGHTICELVEAILARIG